MLAGMCLALHRMPCSRDSVHSAAFVPWSEHHVLLRVDEKAGIDPSARPIFLLNCMCGLSDVLAHHACCASGAAEVAAQVSLMP